MDFNERLNLILVGRKITPWGRVLGMSNSVIQALSAGTAPGSDYLQIISRAENVNLNFLLNCQGTPFVVQETGPDFIQNWLLSAKQSFLYLAVCQGECIFGLESYESLELRGRTVEFKRFDLVSCQLSKVLTETLSNISGGYVIELAPKVFSQLRGGHMGSFLCLGWDGNKGIFHKKTHPLEVLGSDELPIHSGAGDAVDIKLMRAALEVVAYVISERSESVNEADRAKMVASLYKSSFGRGLAANEIQASSAAMLLDML